MSMYDSFNRRIHYLRISVTDRCNLRCRYCMPEEGIPLLQHNDILSFDEIAAFARVGVEHGIDKIRLTGGEPLVRKGIVDLVAMLASIPGIKDLAMTTNAIALESFAKELKSAGLHRVNISLDTLNPDRFREITRGGDIESVLRGIESAVKVGLSPVKLNCVINGSIEASKDALSVRAFGKAHKLEVRFIHQMNLQSGIFSVVEGGSGGDCPHCNRLRLTADGHLQPCLFNSLSFDIRALGNEEALRLALSNKPVQGTQNNSGTFYNIGG